MPLLKIQTNQTLGADQQQALIRAASQQVATLLGKPERYVMVSLEHNDGMLFAGTRCPTSLSGTEKHRSTDHQDR